MPIAEAREAARKVLQRVRAGLPAVDAEGIRSEPSSTIGASGTSRPTV